MNMLGVFVVFSFIAASMNLSGEINRKRDEGILLASVENKLSSVSFVALLAAISGIIGAKIGGIADALLSGNVHSISFFWSESGFSFYGGLIAATATLWFYYKRKKIHPLIMADAIAPGLMLAYAVGRMGCHIAGDGDWGIPNHLAKPIPWLPDWSWAYSYPHNVLRAGIEITGCTWDDYCYRLLEPVFPTALYECVITLVLFSVLWRLRKKTSTIGRTASLYLVLTGVERFFIEFIRINPRLFFGGLSLTQAQLVSLVFISLGMVIYFIAPKLSCNKIEMEH